MSLKDSCHTNVPNLVVVLLVVKRNRTWLATAPVQRDPAVFTSTERAEGHASRDMMYKIQKWNVKSSGVFPILLANTRVDWLGLEDAEIAQNFQVLREGILRDVFSQRASSAWQGAPPQKVTVSLLLPGSGTAHHWLDFLQSQRHFWPSMKVWEHWQQTQQNMEIYKANTFPFCIDVARATQSFEIDNEAARKALESSKTRHARRWQTKEGTYRVKQQYPPDVRDAGDVSMGDA